MRVIVSVKPTPGGGQTSQAARYIAYRERDEEREGKEPRPLFSARENVLSFWKAERALTEGRAPQKDELIHIAVSFRDGDFQALGRNETIRQESLREVTREAVTQIADELRADELRWVAGIHRNTDHPHIHLLIHRAYLDRETRAERRLTRIPAQMLAARFRDENGAEKINPGNFSQAFETALDRAQERARAESGKEKTATSDERLLEAARTNPSLAGRELIQEIILRGPAREPDERPEATDLRAAFRTPSLDDPDYRSQPEQADWLGARSQELRDLYERGAQVKGDVLIIPAEEHELSAAGDQPFITGLAYAHQQIRNAEQAAEFHALARTIAGQTADPRTEIEVFHYYYAEIRTEKLERTLDEMRLLAAEMARLETRESIEIARPVISFEDAQEAEREDRFAENDIERDDDRGYSGEFDHAETARGDEDDRNADAAIGSFNTAARKVRLDDESLRLPAGLNFEMKLQLVTRTLPALDRQMENGRARSEIITAIGEAICRQEADENEREERFRIGGFLKAYVAERLNDPETRALNRSAAFRLAHKQIAEARTPEELNRTAERFLRENLDRGNALRLHQSGPTRYPKPETMPLNHRERSLLFFGRAPEHHTTEMRELRHAWGLSRAERADRVKALREGRLSASPTLEQMITELDSRRSLPAIRHYQASILNEEMRNPGRLNLHQMVDRLPPHERTFLIERIEEKKERITRSQTPTRDLKDELFPASGSRPFGSIPRESHSYREYLANMGAAELRLLNEAVRQRHNGNGHIISKEAHPLTITEARALLLREEQLKIREQARHLAWEQITPPEVFAARPEAPARAVSDTIARLQEETQPRARLAHTALDEFVREKAGVNGRNEPHSADALSRLAPADAQLLRALEDYAVRMREELYRGFESLDALRREIERPRGLDAAERLQSIEPNSHSAPDRDPIFSANGHSAAKDLRLSNGGHFDPDRNSTVDGLPDDRDRHPWLDDSTRKWQFDSLRDLAEPIPVPVGNDSPEQAHDYSFDYER
jgi:hypothetical protein